MAKYYNMQQRIKGIRKQDEIALAETKKHPNIAGRNTWAQITSQCLLASKE
ncbi:MAG: hypothetical protein ACTS73_02940 [Arsenophonus sp. NEOnobi-MAG3]